MSEAPGLLLRSEARGVLLRSLEGETFWFDPGAFCLEFAMTGGEGDRAAYETLHAPDDLRRWIQTALGLRVGQVTAADLAEARRLREAIWQLTDARVLGPSLPRAAVGEINRSAARPPLAPQIDAADARAWAMPVTPGQVLSTVARDAVDLFTGPMASRIRRCAGTNCRLMFVDASRPGRRRWCSMDRCGNRAKVRAFRDRRHPAR
jgi:predicted RNA-binding Zn ribbon-like protein